MAGRVISMALTPESIARGIKEIEAYRDELRAKVNALVEALVAEGVKIAMVQIQMLGAVDTGNLADSMTGAFDAASGMGVIICGAKYGIFVEYGTGIKGQNGPLHPEAGKAWKPPTVMAGDTAKYYGYGPGKHDESGWWYLDENDGEFHWTAGQPSRPFMYETFKELEAIAPGMAAEALNR